jgi:hypothetical protein
VTEKDKHRWGFHPVVAFLLCAVVTCYFGGIAASERGGWALMLAIFFGLTAVVWPILEAVARLDR